MTKWMKIITCIGCEDITSVGRCTKESLESFAEGRPAHALPDALDAGYFIFKHCEECGHEEAAITVRPDIRGVLFVYDHEVLSRA